MIGVINLSNGETLPLIPRSQSGYISTGQLMFATQGGKLNMVSFDVHDFSIKDAFFGKQVVFYTGLEKADSVHHMQNTVSDISYPREWTSDDQIILTSVPRDKTGSAIYIYDMKSGNINKFWDSKGHEETPRLSPKEKWLVFSSDYTGIRELYLMSFPQAGLPVQITNGGGADQVWSRDGKVFYYQNKNKIIELDMTLIPPSAPAIKLFDADFDFTQNSNFDVLPDGRFVMIKGDPSTTSQIHVMQNFLTFE